MAINADTGNGATLTRTGMAQDIVSISLGSQTIETLDASTLATTTYKDLIAADLADAGTVTIEFLFDCNDASEFPTIGEVASTQVSWPIHPVPGTNTTKAKIVGTAIITDVKPPDFRNNELQIASVTMAFDGDTDPAFTVESA